MREHSSRRCTNLNSIPVHRSTTPAALAADDYREPKRTDARLDTHNMGGRRLEYLEKQEKGLKTAVHAQHALTAQMNDALHSVYCTARVDVEGTDSQSGETGVPVAKAGEWLHLVYPMKEDDADAADEKVVSMRCKVVDPATASLRLVWIPVLQKTNDAVVCRFVNEFTLFPTP